MVSRNRKTKSIIWIAFMVIMILLSSQTVLAAERLQQVTNKPIVIVIDPGHGGENNGTTSNNVLEKSMTLTTATEMYDTLSKFDNIEVYLTRSEDVDMTLKERAQMASDLHADFLISVHYNASESGLPYGSEVWTSLVPDFHNFGYQLGTMFLKEYQNMGLSLRGIKTRKGEKGDYYGILRESIALEVPAIIIEHCYVNHYRDYPFCETEEKQKALGKADALAVAKYFGLKSSALGMDFSDYPSSLPAVNAGQIAPLAYEDTTPPEDCTISLKEYVAEDQVVTLEVTAHDEQSNLLYYTYSIDGGASFSEFFPWPQSDILAGTVDNTFDVDIPLDGYENPEICICAYNRYDLFTSSEILQIDDYIMPGELEETAVLPEEYEAESLSEEIENSSESSMIPSNDRTENDLDQLALLKFLILIVFVLFFICLCGYLIVRKRNRKYRSNNEDSADISDPESYGNSSYDDSSYTDASYGNSSYDDSSYTNASYGDSSYDDPYEYEEFDDSYDE